MSLQQAEGWTRRRFLGGLTVAGAAGLLGLYPRPIAAEPPPETTTLRTARTDSLCQAPKYVAAALLQGEGFTDVQHKHYPEGGAPPSNLLRMQELASGELDIDSMFAPMVITRLEAGDPIVVLAGVHIGCMELYRIERVRAIRDLRGKTVAVPKLGGVHYLFLASMLAYTGLAPRTDLHWMTPARAEAVWLLAEGKIDALLTPRHGRRNSGPSRSGTSWSTRAWIGPGPSTSAAWRSGTGSSSAHTPWRRNGPCALLKAADICALEPERAAQFLVDKDYVRRYDYALQAMKEIPYGKWREYDAEDTLRLFTLRLHEAGMIKSTPQKLLAQGTDWSFLNELKRELKG